MVSILIVELLFCLQAILEAATRTLPQAVQQPPHPPLHQPLHPPTLLAAPRQAFPLGGPLEARAPLPVRAAALEGLASAYDRSVLFRAELRHIGVPNGVPHHHFRL